MRVYTTSKKPSSSATEKRENKILHQFQLKKKPEIFEVVMVKTIWVNMCIKYLYEDFEDNSK